MTDLLSNKIDPSPIITPDDTIKSLQSIKSGNSAGPDIINRSWLKMCREPISPI